MLLAEELFVTVVALESRLLLLVLVGRKLINPNFPPADEVCRAGVIVRDEVVDPELNGRLDDCPVWLFSLT
jgi:hypothetical protein